MNTNGQTGPMIGIITALPTEYAAVKAILENTRDRVVPGRGAGRRYLRGEIPAADRGTHSVVLSLADKGTNAAAARATRLLEHFPTVNSIIMVGIAGGVPYPEKPDEHVRLGDVVVSNQKGVVQYDFIKEEISETEHRHPPRPPSASLSEAVRYLEVAVVEGKSPWSKFVDLIADRLGVTRPSEQTDILVSSTDQEEVIPHPEDPDRIADQPRIFLGPIASANDLLKNPVKRDELRDRFGAKAVEMEGSGIADATWNLGVGYLVVRGICDYCDSNKGDVWQKYAAIVAAAYTGALLESMLSCNNGPRIQEETAVPEAVHSSQLPALTLKLFEVSGEYEEKIALQQTGSLDYQRFSFNLALLNTAESSVPAEKLDVTIKIYWAGSKLQHQPRFGVDLHGRTTPGWTVQRPNVEQYGNKPRPAVLRYSGSADDRCAFGQALEWRRFSLELWEKAYGPFQLHCTISSKEPHTTSKDTLEIYMS